MATGKKINHRYYLRIVLCCISLWFSLTAYPQVQDFIIGVQDGLSDNEITCLQQDDWGFWWIGTPTGLNRYDGRQVKQIAIGEENASAIHDLQLLPNYRLAIAAGNGLTILDCRTQQFRTWQLPGDSAMRQYRNRIERVVPLPRGRLAVYSLTGVYVLDAGMQVIAKREGNFAVAKARSERIHFGLRMDAFSNGDLVLAATDGYWLYHFAGNRFLPIAQWHQIGYDKLGDLIAPHRNSYIFDIDPTDRFFFMDNKRANADSLLIYEQNTKQVFTLKLPFVPSQQIRWDNHFQFFPNSLTTLTTSFDGYYQFSLNDANQWLQAPALQQKGIVCRILGFDSAAGYRLTGTIQGLHIRSLAEKVTTRLNLPKKPGSSRLLIAAYAAPEGLYFADYNNNGVLYCLPYAHPSAAVSTIRLHTRGGRSLVQTIQSFNHDTLMLATETGLQLLRQGTTQAMPLHIAYPKLKPLEKSLLAAARNNKGILWLAGQEQQGIWRIDLQTGATAFFANGQKPNNLPLRAAQQIVFDSHGEVWLHHYADGTVRFNEATQSFDQHLSALSPEGKTPYAIAGIAAADSGRLWAFLNGYGLVKLNPLTGACSTVVTIEDRAANYANPLTVHKDGWLLLTLTRGAYAYHPPSGRLQTLNHTGDLFPQQLRHATPGPENHTMITGHGDFLQVWNYRPGQPTLAVQSHITSVTTSGGTRLDRFQKLRLPYHDNDLRIEFSTRDGQYGEPGRHAYRLAQQGESAEWQPLGNQPFVYLTNLPAGSYRLEVKSLQADQAASAGTDGFSFTILNPWYATLWFRLSVLACLTLLIGWLVWYRQRQKRQAAAIREQISADLHDAIGSRLTNLRFMNQMALQQQESAAPLLGKMDDELEASSQALHQLVWRMKWQSTRLSDLEALMRRDANELLNVENIDITFDARISQPDMRLVADQFHDILLMNRELLTNIRKHAQAKNVSIRLQQKGRHATLLVNDDGIGFNANRAHGRNGLSILAMRLSKWKGSFAIDVGPAGGTKVRLQLRLMPASSLKGIARQYLNL